MSGVKIHKTCLEAYDSFKMGKANRYIIFKMNEEITHVIPEVVAASDATFESMLEELPKKDCRYVLYDVEYTNDGCDMSKIVFILWSPDGASRRSKMLYTSTKRSFKAKLTGIKVDYQAKNMSQLNIEQIVARLV
eukprot:gnl/Dysnectes_brevis/87_a106_5700.p2 GENE.gnl/Dysnectes_brevis/87_a106_5700~~gnl/Dysnectes_brevis/87_a106_5700.p2  ORF type:complete len:135 (-),score=35.54 gnl/Dysnectes_brevis/87_a106_5700:89-493(-)